MLRALRRLIQQRRRSAKLSARFTLVHDKNLWGSEESRSGAGSVRGTPWVAFAEEAIAKAVREHGVKSINDIPCGDFNWMPGVLEKLDGVRYSGFDIVKAVLEKNKSRFPKLDFQILDITTRAPPAADLIFCKDLLNHLTDEDVKNAIANMRRSGSTFLLASNNPGWQNTPLPQDGPEGSRHLDIMGPPFNFREPLWTVGGYMSLWRLADMGECGF